MKLYLAHNYGTRFQVRDVVEPKWKQKFDIDFLNPFADRPALYDVEDNSEKYAEKINEQLGGLSAEQIVENDLRDIRESDGLIAYMKNVSIGTNMEIFYNSYFLKRPTIAVVKNPDLLHHVWLRHLTTPILEWDLTRYRFDQVYRNE